MNDIELSESTKYNGNYKGIPFEIVRFKPFDPSTNNYSWCHYIYIYDTQVITEKLELPLEYFTAYGTQLHQAADWIHKLDFHGGCTYYRIEEKNYLGNLLKIGCDYQHYFDDYKNYSITQISEQVKKTIDSLFILFPKIILRDQLLNDFRNRFPRKDAGFTRYDSSGKPLEVN